ncbi:hypothetical protein Lal_00014685 [Lupinus albus]|nr:hypothetical protein Lal_00014685 [Lupinus albus]
MGPGYKAPNFYHFSAYLLNKWVEDTGRNRCTLINFLVYCPKGIVILKSVDASHASKTTDLLFKFQGGSAI